MPPASFRPHLTMDPLPLAVCLLWSYRTWDFHPLDYTHAGRTPYPRLRRYFPRRGKFALRSASVLISPSRHSSAKICPSGEDAAAGGRRGVFPSPVRAVGLFSPARQGGCEGFIIRGAPSKVQNTPPLSPKGDVSPMYKKGEIISGKPYLRPPRPLPPQQRTQPLAPRAEGPMDAIRPSAPKAQAPSGIQESAADAPGPERDPDPGPDPFSYSLFLTC